ncbi:hypothetical protein E2C01_002938 [Portunus trituberculatus]|uniref:Uncharacterized protein n=1 Tax=Portunus trituberculatus TaxID=210409 RepID=A0A5B7CM39_PORTR|nr:hypothetical protein [Portunus trituberculatus]
MHEAHDIETNLVMVVVVVVAERGGFIHTNTRRTVEIITLGSIILSQGLPRAGCGLLQFPITTPRKSWLESQKRDKDEPHDVHSWFQLVSKGIVTLLSQCVVNK